MREIASARAAAIYFGAFRVAAIQPPPLTHLNRLKIQPNEKHLQSSPILSSFFGYLNYVPLVSF